MVSFTLNGQDAQVDVAPDTPLLWVIRENLGLTGTKFGCGIAQCGACTVHLDGSAVRSCSLPVSVAAGRSVTTIEGLANEGLANEGLANEGLANEARLHPLQQAWIEHQVPQCGYCQSGQLMSAAALLARSPAPSDEEIDRAMAGNICRCGMYGRIRRAIKSVSRAGVQAYVPVTDGEVQRG